MLRILETFGGIGACTEALKRLQIPFVTADYVEIDKYAVKSYNAINGTNFEPQDVTTWDKDIDVDLIMHGSPCQDFSVAGKGAGGDEGSGTRSSLMYETIRIVEKLKPKYVIWENVKNVLSKKHIHNFNKYTDRLEELGYTSYYKVLNAKHYGVPQNRERVFTISIREDVNFLFKFPEPIELKKRLKDLLEQEVDEKFYLSDAQVKRIHTTSYVSGGERRIQKKEVADTLCARDWKDPKCVQVGDLQGEKWDKMHDMSRRVYSGEGVSPTIHTIPSGKSQCNDVYDPNGLYPSVCAGTHGNANPSIIDDTYKNREPREYTDVSPAIRAERSGFKVTEPIIGASRGRNPENPSDRTPKYNYVIEPMIEKAFDIPKEVLNDNERQRRVYSDSGISPTLLNRSDSPKIEEPQLRIRKLTPRECWRLMGFTDEAFDKAEKVNSNTQLYKQAGNSIVVDVLAAILQNLLMEETENEELKKDGWIPVSERLPEKDGECYKMEFVTLKNGERATGVYRNEDREWWTRTLEGSHLYDVTDKVIAWQPLPEPYKGE